MNTLHNRKMPCFAQCALALLAVGFVVLLAVFMNTGLGSVESLKGRQTAAIFWFSVEIALFVAFALWTWWEDANILSFGLGVFLLLAMVTAYQLFFDGFSKHMIMIFAGLAAGVWVYLFWRRRGNLTDRAFYILFGATIALMLANLLFGYRVNGAKLWINLGFFTFQPGELAKVFLIVLGASAWRSKKRMWLYCTATLITTALLVYLKDFGGAIVCVSLFLLATYLLFDSIALSLSIITAAVVIFISLMVASPYALSRLTHWGEAMTNPVSVQQKQLITAVIYGGFNGLGFEYAAFATGITAAQHDCAMAGFMAIFGIPMTIVFIASYVLILIQPRWNMGTHPSSFLILSQIALYIFIQCVLNSAGSLDLLPWTGLVAPWISQGGTAAICFGMVLGLAAAAMNPKITQNGGK